MPGRPIIPVRVGSLGRDFATPAAGRGINKSSACKSVVVWVIVKRSSRKPLAGRRSGWGNMDRSLVSSSERQLRLVAAILQMQFHIHKNLLQRIGFVQKAPRFVQRNHTIFNRVIVLGHQRCKSLG